MTRTIKLMAVIFAISFATFAFTSNAHAALWGCDWSGNLYNVNSTNAALSFIGGTGLSELGALEFAPDGTLYGYTAGSGSLYKIDPNTASPTLVGSLGLFDFEGGLAFSSSGIAYGVHSLNSNEVTTHLFTIDLNTGVATDGPAIGTSYHDIDGIAWRSDGMLVALADDGVGALLTIDPITGAVSTITNLPFSVGASGGMTTDFSSGISFFGTGSGLGNDGNLGNSSLYSFDLFSGAYSLIGPFSGLGDTSGQGLSGLAGTPTIPEPATLSLLGLGLAGIGILRRRNRK